MTRLHVTDDLEVAAATHVGRVRNANEDDFLIVVPRRRDAVRRGRLFAIADGMGGVAGGAQASRAALRALGATFAAGLGGAVDGAGAAGEDRPDDQAVDRAGERLVAGFDAASDRVHALAGEAAVLADMGTTMTALLLRDSTAVIAHVGDTRCLRIRGGVAEQLTTDHAMREPRNLLTRAIGAGQRHETVDLVDVDVRPGDVFVLLTDGVWGVVEADEIAQELRPAALQLGCERLLGLVFSRGAPDNATIVAVRMTATAIGSPRDIDLPSSEARIGLADGGFAPGRVVPTHWPYLLLTGSVVLTTLAWLRISRGFDLFEWLRELFG